MEIWLVCYPKVNIIANNNIVKDLRYLHKKDKFLEYAYLALSNNFSSREEFEEYFESIKNDDRKSLFLRTASFYLFTVKRGDWFVNIPDSNNRIDYLTNTFKYVAIFSLIESLSEGKFVDFYQFIVSKKHGIHFPISDKSKFDEIYKKYKEKFGSIKRCISFFKALPLDRQRDLVSRLEIRGTEASIENLAKYLYELRSKFVHEAELVLNMSDETTVSRKEKKLVICRLSIKDAMHFFEEGLIEQFRN